MAGILITTADDFGCSGAVNRAVLRAHREGALTSASLMVTGDAAAEAAAIARDNPQLAVGLHLALTHVRPALAPALVPRLIGPDGLFHRNDIGTGLRCYFDAQARAQVRREVEAQFEAFARLGMPLSHVDGHQHLHAHPCVLPIVAELAVRYGARGIRVPRTPRESPFLSRSRSGYRLAVTLGHAYLSRVCDRVLRGLPLASCDVVIGGVDSGAMSTDCVLRAVSRANAGSVEIYFHPSEEDSGDGFGPNSGDLETLLSSALRESISGRGYRLGTYASLLPEGARR